MRKVHSAKQLFHLFCNMTNSDLEGFRTSSRNVYFENSVLYSYGSHYPMAVKTSFNVGQDFREVILINSEQSSVTTQKHKSQLHSSTKPKQWVFYVPNIQNPRSLENYNHLIDVVVEAIDAVLRRLKYWSVDEVTQRIERVNQYALAFKMKQFKLDPVFYTDLAILSAETAKKSEAKEKLKYEKQDAERKANREKWANEVKLWYSCQNTMNISSSYFGLNYDPVRVNSEIVESPRGAQVSLAEAKVFCQALKDRKIMVGVQIGPFKVESIDSEIVEIGCHKINIQQAINAVLGA